MSLLEESPASPAAPAAEPSLERPHFSVNFKSDSAEPEYTSYNQAGDSILEGLEPTPPSAPEPEPPAQEPEPEPRPEPSEPEPQPRDLAAVFADIKDDEFREQLRQHPRLKRFLDGELGSRIAAEREAIRQQAIAETNQEIAEFEDTWANYQRIEELRLNDPETFAATYDNSAYAVWVAEVMKTRDYLVAKQALRPQKADPAAPNVEALRQEWQDGWNTAAIAGVHEVLAKVPDIAKFPQDVRRNLAALQLGDGNWVQEYTDNLVKGYKALHAKELKDAVEAARIAGRNEASAGAIDDQPMPPASRPATGTRSDDEILIEHALHGFRTGITQEELDAVYRRRGMK